MIIKEIIYQNRRDFKAKFICPHCGYEEEKWGYCTDCFNGEWSKKIDEMLLEDIDTKIQQARNLLYNYYRLNREYGGYDDAVESYEEYIQELKSMKEGNV